VNFNDVDYCLKLRAESGRTTHFGRSQPRLPPRGALGGARKQSKRSRRIPRRRSRSGWIIVS